jgi:ribonuclease BN (tRNA processing enzyme)
MWTMQRVRLDRAVRTLLVLIAVAAAGETRVVLLGTGTPNADPERSGPASAVVVDGASYLVDFGPGVVRRASAAAARLKMDALLPKNLRTAFVTHLHSDHTAGYADLILTPAVLERDAPLEVYGPPGLNAMTRHILAAYREDMHIRFHGGEPAKPRGYVVHPHEVRPGVVYRDDAVEVEAFRVPHGAWRDAYGYRFQTRDHRTIVISGDTGPSDAIVAKCNACDVLVHEVYSEAGLRSRPPEWQKYHAKYHTSTRELGDIAKRARPGLLVLTHQLIWTSTPAAMLAEIGERYQGRVVFGADLDVY